MLAKTPPACAGTVLHAYMLIEQLRDGSCLRDVFNAPGNAEAIARAEEVVEGEKAELWRDAELVCCWGRNRSRRLEVQEGPSNAP